MLYLNIFFLGIAFGWTACVASCGPLILSYNVGTNRNVSASLVSYVLFSLTRITVYILLSILVYFSGTLIFKEAGAAFLKYIYLAGGIFTIIVGLFVVSGKNEKMSACNFLHKKLFLKDNKNMLFFGAVIGFLPCAPLLAFFSYVALISKSWPECLVLTLAFGLGTFFSPLFILVAVLGLLPNFLLKFKPIYKTVLRVIAGIMLFILGVELLGRFFNA